MNWRVVQGATVLAITLATVGSLAASEQTAEAGPGATGDAIRAGLARYADSDSDTAIGTGAGTAEMARTEVPVRSGLGDGTVDDQAGAVAPVTVRIAGIGLEAPVIPVGVDEEHRFDVPAADTVGWYRYSALPGEAGASVLAAHVDYGGRAGAFYHLGQVVPGDALEVVLDDGRVQRYVVTGNTQYQKSELPADDLFRKDGDPVLQLITCGGTFDPGAHSYQANVVVTAVPVSA